MMTKAIFEQYVPSFRDCEDEIFSSIEHYLQKVEESIRNEFSINEENFPSTEIENNFLQYQAKRGAYEAIPHLDLILTSNGFAVTSNQNLTPASRQRVYDLRERLRREKSDARDALMQSLFIAGSYIPNNLLWCPTLVRKYGIRTRDGKSVYEEEMQFLQTDIDAAQHKAAMIISEEQMLAIFDSLATDEHHDLTELCRRFMAAYINHEDRGVRLMAHQIQDHLNRNIDSYPEYRASSKYEADHFTWYENKKDDACYFFG